MSDDGDAHMCTGSALVSPIDGVREGEEYIRGKHFQICPNPKCRTKCELRDGCNHMTCAAPSCGASFCFVCGEPAQVDSLHWTRKEDGTGCPRYSHFDDVNAQFDNNAGIGIGLGIDMNGGFDEIVPSDSDSSSSSDTTDSDSDDGTNFNPRSDWPIFSSDSEPQRRPEEVVNSLPDSRVDRYMRRYQRWAECIRIRDWFHFEHRHIGHPPTWRDALPRIASTIQSLDHVPQPTDPRLTDDDARNAWSIFWNAARGRSTCGTLK